MDASRSVDRMDKDLLAQARTMLRLQHYVMNDEWLRDCVAYYLEMHKNRAVSKHELIDFVKNQWQLSDLRDISDKQGCLPPGQNEVVCSIMFGTFIVQLQEVYDLVTSKLEQLNRLKKQEYQNATKVVNEEIDDTWNKSRRRMLQLKLTDGCQTILGIEYGPIPKLSPIMLPGYKIMLIGPIKCRKGILLLEEKNVVNVGGEVDTLLDSNSVENVLAKRLKIAVVTKPPDYEALEKARKEKTEVLFKEPRARPAEQPKERNVVAPERPPLDDSLFGEDFEIDSQELSMLEQSVSQRSMLEDKTEKRTDKVRAEVKVPVEPLRSFPRENPKDADEIIVINGTPEVGVHGKPKEKERHKQRETSDSGPSKHKGLSSLQTVPLALPSTSTSKKETDMAVVSVKKDEKPPQQLEFICDILRTARDERVVKKIRGQMQTMGKLEKVRFEWKLNGTIFDGTGSCDVTFSNKVLEDVLELTVQEFLRKKQLRKYPEIEQQLRMAFRRSENKLKNLDALLEVEFQREQSPKVLKITELTAEEKKSFDERLKALKD